MCCVENAVMIKQPTFLWSVSLVSVVYLLLYHGVIAAKLLVWKSDTFKVTMGFYRVSCGFLSVLHPVLVCYATVSVRRLEFRLMVDRIFAARSGVTMKRGLWWEVQRSMKHISNSKCLCNMCLVLKGNLQLHVYLLHLLYSVEYGLWFWTVSSCQLFITQHDAGFDWNWMF